MKMTTDDGRQMTKSNQAIVAHRLSSVVALLFVGAYLLTALPRIFYPYDLDFIEDSMLMRMDCINMLSSMKSRS